VDGFGLIEGDTIRIGAASVTITSITGNVVRVTPCPHLGKRRNCELPHNDNAPIWGE
jgi:hypothetical protein